MVENCEDVKQIIRHEYPYLKNHFGIKRIGLFGSFVHRRCRKESDVDLVVEFFLVLIISFIYFVNVYLKR